VDPANALWIGGLPDAARSFVARSVAERYDLRLRSLPTPELPTTVRELARASVRRFRDVLEEVREWPGPGLVVEGIDLFPTSVAAVLRSPEQALFLLPDGAGGAADPLQTDLALAFERDTRDLRLRVQRVDRPLEELAALAVEQLRLPT
jgi:hypothetical protein